MRIRAAAIILAAATALTVTTVTVPADAAELVHQPKSGPAIPDAYIAVLAPQASQTSVILHAHAAGDIDVTHRYGKASNGFSFHAGPAEAERVARLTGVRGVWADAPVQASTTQPSPPWGLDRIDQRSLPLNAAYTYTGTGAGVTAYVIDTGIRPTHTQFGGRAAVAADFVGDGGAGIDCNGHGTHVAATIGGSTYGVAKAVELRAVRVLNCSGSGSFAGVIAGIDWVAANAAHPALANMSLGGSYFAPVDIAVTGAVDSGVAFAVAAGNSNADAGLFSPADTPAALVVGATDDTDTRASFSNWGAPVDLFAPGVAVLSAWHTSDSATAVLSGTSMASPHAAGVMAVWLSRHPTAAAGDVEQAVVDLAGTGKVTDPAGSSDRLAYSPQRLPSRTALDAYRTGGSTRILGRVTDATWDRQGVGGAAGLWFRKAGTASYVREADVTVRASGLVTRLLAVGDAGTWQLRYDGSTVYAGSTGTDAA